MREIRVKSASISYNRQRERRRGKRTPNGDSEEDEEEYEETKGRRTSDDVHDVSDDREGDDALAIKSVGISKFLGKTAVGSRYKKKHKRSIVVVVIACLTARSTTRLRLRTI